MKHIAEQFELEFERPLRPSQKCMDCGRETGGDRYCAYHQEIREDNRYAREENDGTGREW